MTPRFPSTTPNADGFELFSYHAPLRGTDFFDFIQRPGGQLAVFVGTVIGLGDYVARIMPRVHATLKTRLESEVAIEKALQTTNDELVLRGRIVPVVIVLLDPQTAEIEVTIAGHLPPWLSDGNGAVRRVEESEMGIPLGLTGTNYSTKHNVRMQYGDCLTIVTDGIVEASNETGALYGRERMARCVATRATEPTQICEGIVNDVTRFRGKEPQDMDMSIVCVARVF